MAASSSCLRGLLHAGSFASYPWGGLLLRASGSATANGSMIFQIAGQVSAGTFRWEQQRDVRVAIAIQHELVHLQQDLTTGIGAWDHLTTRDAYPLLTAQTRFYVSKHSQPPYMPAIALALKQTETASDVRAALDNIRHKTMALRQIREPKWPTRQIADTLSRWMEMTPSELSRLDMSLREILEGEAAAHVHLLVRSSETTTTSAAQLDRDQDLWNVLAMAPIYHTALQRVLYAVANGPPDNIGSIQADLIYTSWILDLVQSYPPPAVLASYGSEADLFDPCARFALLLKATTLASEENMGAILEALFQGEPRSAEEILLRDCPFRYPTTMEIYESWLKVLTPLADADTWDAPLFKLRNDALQHRISTGRPKGVLEAIEARIPIQILVEGFGIIGIRHNEQLLDENWEGLSTAIVSHQIDIELFHLFYDGLRFQCPLERAHICDARTHDCRRIELFEQLPKRDECYVRRSLEQIGYIL
jgi:hypothetical protein